MSASIAFEPIKPDIGALAHVAKADICDPAVVAAVRAELEWRGVIVFPEIDLSDAEQLAFTDAFGQRLDYTRSADKDGDDVYRISLSKKSPLGTEYVLATWFWHIDGVTVDQPLPKATMLSARRLSETGGQTEFANTFAAYAQLPEAQRREIADLKVIHRLESAMRCVHQKLDDAQRERYAQSPDMELPMVWTQPDGRRSLVLGSHADEVVGMSYTAGRSLITRLIEWAAQPKFSYSHEWRQGDFVIWNNCGVMHRVVPYEDGSDRMMQRTSIMGDQRLGRPVAR